MKSYIVAHFNNGVIIEFKRKPKSMTPQPLTLKVAENAVRKLNTLLGEKSPQDHWGVLTINQLAEINRRQWSSLPPTVGK